MKKITIHDIEIWKRTVETTMFCFDLSVQLKENFLYRYAERLQKAALGFYINIAEASESQSAEEYMNYMNLAKHSLLETSCILSLLNEKKLISEETKAQLMKKLDLLSLDLDSLQPAA